jgi:ComF family protein
LKEAINHFKYFRKKRLLRPLAELLCTLDIPAVDVVLPVPLHRSRLQERGFNQSALIARQIAGKHALPLLINTLVRVRNTPQQVGLNARRRRKNIAGVFSVLQGNTVAGRRVLLVDDVITTGATVQECTRELLHAGAVDVHVMSLARGVQD